MFHSMVESSRKRKFWAGPAWLFVGLLGFALACPDETLAQRRGGLRRMPRGDEEDVPDGAMPGSLSPGTRTGRGLPPGMSGGRPAFDPRFNPDGTPRKAKKLQRGDPKDAGALEEDPNKLPKGFSVPPEPPDWLTTTEEWVFDPFKRDNEKDQRDEKKKLAIYKDLALKGELTKDADKQLIAEVVEWKLSQLTRKENREKSSKLREELFRDIKLSGTGRGGKQEVRVLMLQTVVEKAPKLFSYHFTARLNGAILLADLSEINEKEQEGRNLPVRFTKAYAPLIDLLKQVDEQNRKQPDAVRIWAVDGLMRIGAIPETRPLVRGEIVDVLVEQLASSANDHEWLQWRLTESLGVVGVAYNSLQKPIAPQVLAEVLVDPQRSWLVRAEAAQSLGRLPLGRDIDLGLIAREIAHLAEQMADAYQKKPDQAVWKLSFLKLYLAFKPANDDEAKKDRGLLTQVTNKSTLAAHKRAVQEAYDVVLPIVQGVVNPPQSIEQAVNQLKDWLSRNPPRATRIAEKEEPIFKPARSGAAPEPAPAGGNAAAG
jgi:hypothetical protein